MKTHSDMNSPVHAKPYPVKSTYEPGMKISYDKISKRVVVAFRGRITVLPETYDVEETGIAAGEGHCRHLGWRPLERVKPARQLRSLF
jgi:hypothetical protein